MQLSTVQTTGHVTKDPVLRKGQSGTNYLRLNIAADKGFGENKSSVFFQATFFSEQAERIVKAKVKKGSFIELAGEITDVTTFQKEGTEEFLSMIKVDPYRWCYVSASSKKGEADTATQETSAPVSATNVVPMDFPEVRCGLEDELPN